MKIAVVGFGVVGSGVAEVLERNFARIARLAGEPVTLKYIVDVRDLSGTPWAPYWIKDYQIAIEDDEVGLVVETIGGIEPGYTLSKRALAAGKHVVTSNKELVATHGAELLRLAGEHGVNYLFEASVGGGIPVLHPLHRCLGGGEVLEIAGILNGTTNFIITRMFGEGMSFADALALAQKNGYAEANPAADVEGHDACRKICILASMAWGRRVAPDEVLTEGITALTRADVETASAAGYVLKLIGRAKQKGADGKPMAMVSPALLPKESPLANVSDVYNAILVRGAETGDVLFYGRGAGKNPTASAVLSDVCEAARERGHIGTLGWEDAPGGTLGDGLADVTRVMVRASGADQTALSELFGELAPVQAPAGEVAGVTRPLSGYQVQKARELAPSRGVAVQSVLRILEY